MKENQKRQFKGIWIPAKLWLTKELTILEKIFLVEIDSLNNKEGCWASNQYFADFFAITKQRCSQIIKSIEKKGFIKITYERKGKEISKRIIKMTVFYSKEVSNKLDRVSNKFEQGIKKIRIGYQENSKENNTCNNTKNNTCNKEILFPTVLDTPEFKETWEIWAQFRKEIKKKITPTTAIAQLSKLEKVGSDAAIKMIKQSIENGWQGLFPLKAEPKSKWDF